MDKENVVTMYDGKFSNEKERKPVICNNRNELEGHEKNIRQTQKGKFCMISLILGICKNQTFRSNK